MKRRCSKCRELVEASSYEAHRQGHKNAEAPSPTERGYGAVHRATRERWRPFVEAGQIRCRRCDEPIAPGADWDLDHGDEPGAREAGQYLGPTHASCNRATMTHRASPGFASGGIVPRPPSD